VDETQLILHRVDRRLDIARVINTWFISASLFNIT